MQYYYQNELEKKEYDLNELQKKFQEYQIKLKKQFVKQTKEFEQNQIDIFNQKIVEEI